ncbi:unnamed protein product [Cutaneotrichosporon oleaginosum]
MLALLLLPVVAGDISPLFGGLFGPSPPLIPFNTTLAAADGNLYRNNDEWSCRVLDTKPLSAGGGWKGPTCSAVGPSGFSTLIWSGGNASLFGYSAGVLSFINSTDELQETYASVPASPDTNTVFELGILPVPGNGFWQVQVRGPIEFGLTGVHIRTALNSDAPDFKSVGRRTEPAIVNGTLSPFYSTTREWAVYTNYTNFPTLKSPGAIVRQPMVGRDGTVEREVTTPDTFSNLTFGIPTNTSYLALAGLSDGQMSAATLFLSFGNTVRELPLRYGSVYRAPLSMIQLALNPNLQYAAVLAPENNTRPVAFHSATFYSSLWPVPDGYSSGGNTAISYLDYIAGDPVPSPIDPSFVASPQPGPAGNGVGGGVGALIVALIAFLLFRRKRKQRSRENRRSFIIEETDPGLTPFKESSGPIAKSPVLPTQPKSNIVKAPLSAEPMSAGPSAPQSLSHGRAMDGDDDVQRLPPMYNPAWNVAHTSGETSTDSPPATATPTTPLEHKDVITSGRFKEL